MFASTVVNLMNFSSVLLWKVSIAISKWKAEQNHI